MKETLKYAVAIGITAAAMFAYMYAATPRQAGQELAKTAPALTNEAPAAKSVEQASHPHQTPPQRELSPAELADIDPASIDWEAMKERYEITADYYDPMILRWAHLGGFTDAEIAAFNKLHMVPFNPMVDQTCERSLSGIEGVGDADGVWEVCTTIHLYDEHPYESLSLEELKPLAEDDPFAAELAIRLAEDFQSRMEFALKAVALSGKPGPILEGLSRSGVISLAEDRSAEAILDEILVKMVFERAAQALGDPRPNTDSLERLIDDYVHSPLEKEDFLKNVQNNVDELLNVLAKTQQEATGSTTIWEATNA